MDWCSDFIPVSGRSCVRLFQGRNYKSYERGPGQWVNSAGWPRTPAAGYVAEGPLSNHTKGWGTDHGSSGQRTCQDSWDMDQHWPLRRHLTRSHCIFATQFLYQICHGRTSLAHGWHLKITWGNEWMNVDPASHCSKIQRVWGFSLTSLKPYSAIFIVIFVYPLIRHFLTHFLPVVCW